MYVANADEKPGKQDFARRTKIFRVGQKFSTQSLKIFVLYKIKFFGGTIFFLTGQPQKPLLYESSLSIRPRAMYIGTYIASYHPVKCILANLNL